MRLPRGSTPVLLLGLALVIAACGDDGGSPNYTVIRPPDQKFEEPEPFQPGKERLSVDVFYEGGRTETIFVNGFRNFYFIFGRPEIGRDTFSQSPSGDRLEGEQSDEITLVGAPFWGGGIVWDEPIDLSEWKKLFVSFKSSDRSFATFDITLLYGEGEMPRSVVLDPRDYGYTNDGLWHFLEIDLEDAVARGLDPSLVRSPFIISASGGEAGDTLLVDNLYLTKF